MPSSRKTASNSAAKARRAKKPHNFPLALTEVSLVADAFLVGLEGERLGEVVATASSAGQDAIGKLFRGASIDWTESGGFPFPDDWRECSFTLPFLIEDLPLHGLAHNLPQHLIDLRPLDSLNADQWAMLMASGVSHQGARAAFWSNVQNCFHLMKGPRTYN